MNNKSRYRTRQRDTLQHYLETVPGKHFTAADVCDYFRQAGTPIGQSTVYRQLECMVSEGLVKKYIIDGTSPACFEYIGDTAEAPENVCFHFKCEQCGRLIHLHCDELAGLQEHLAQEHHVALNPMRTVLYGLCEDCTGKDNYGTTDSTESVSRI